jgi:hypothetical protein
MKRVRLTHVDAVKKVKLQSRIPLTTRYRLVKVAETEGITGTQAITDLIRAEHAAYFKKGDKSHGSKT